MPRTNQSQLVLILASLCVLLALPALGQGTFPPIREAFIAIEGAILIDGTGAPPAAGVTLLIEENRIRQIGSSDEVRIPAQARRINGRGKYLIPGLINAHVHYSAPFLHRLYLAHGVTTVRDVGTAVDKILTLREEIAAGNLLAPRLVVSGMGINPRSVKSGGFESARAMTEYLANRGVDGIKVTGYTLGELKEIVEVAHAHGLLVYGHTRIDPGALAAAPRRAPIGSLPRRSRRRNPASQLPRSREKSQRKNLFPALEENLGPRGARPGGPSHLSGRNLDAGAYPPIGGAPLGSNGTPS